MLSSSQQEPKKKGLDTLRNKFEHNEEIGTEISIFVFRAHINNKDQSKPMVYFEY